MNPLATEDTCWGSHLVPLFACITATRGPVLELGIGHWSTPLLHAYICSGGRQLVSIEDSQTWVDRFADLNCAGHRVLCNTYDRAIVEALNAKWSVVFLDQSPGWRRAADALALREVSDYIVVHDYSGAEVSDPFQPILALWPYRAVAGFSPTTLVLGMKPIPDFEKRIDV